MCYGAIKSSNIWTWLLYLSQMFFLRGKISVEWADTVHRSLLWQHLHCGARDSPRAWFLPRAVQIRQRQLRENCVRKHPIRFNHKLILFKFKGTFFLSWFVLTFVLFKLLLHLSAGSVKKMLFFKTCDMQEGRTILEKLAKITPPPMESHMTTGQWCTMGKTPSPMEMDPQ